VSATRPWSRIEDEAIVSDYFDMFERELRGDPYSKTEHRRRLQKLLDDRTDGSIEYKHQNISAVLIELGQPYIDGYKPQRNYQELLFDVVADRLTSATSLLRLIGEQALQDAEVPAVERFVLNFERARLLHEGRDKLAADVEQVSVTRGDYEGFDVLSFEISGTERLIEVKTTTFGRMTPFFVSRNQVEVSDREKERYHVYRLFRFRDDPRFFSLRGSIRSNFELSPSQFRAALI